MDRHEVADLVRLCANGRNPDVWNEFVERFQNRLHAGVRRALARCESNLGEQEREDLIQEVYCRLLDRRGRCLRLCRGREEASVGAYLGRVAENVVLDHLRSIGAVKRGRDRLLDIHPDSTFDPLGDAADTGATPEERLLARERQQTFLRRFRKVLGKSSPERDWQVFYMAVFEGWSSREISSRFSGELKPSTVDSLIHRLRRRLSDAGMKVPRRSPPGPSPR